MAGETSLTTRILLWFMTALTSVASFVAVQYNSRLNELRELKDQDKVQYQKNIDAVNLKNFQLEKDKDSLQSVILKRTDSNHDQWKREIEKLITLEEKNSTITITPKRRK